MDEIFTGHCQCGELSYRVTGVSLTLFACHCKDCQRQSSSAFGMALWIKTSSVEIVSGGVQTWKRVMPSGQTMYCDFCPVCGTRVFHRRAGQEDIVSIKPGTLDDSRWLDPVAHIWTASAQPWLDISKEECLLFPQNPSSFDAFFEAWNQKRRST
jgi:hypothetical protein